MNKELEIKTDIQREEEFAKKSLVLFRLYDVLADNKANPKEGSYTSGQFKAGLDRMLKKVGEEAGEVIIAAKNNDSKELVWEVTDLFFQTMMVMVEKGIRYEDVFEELERRRKK